MDPVILRAPHQTTEYPVIGIYDDDIIYWRQPHHGLHRYWHWLIHGFDYVINFLLILLAMAGIIAIYPLLTSLVGETFAYEKFFSELSWERLVFWVSVLADIELYYRVERALHRVKNITVVQALQKMPTVVNDWENISPLVPKLGINAAQFVAGDTQRLVDQISHLTTPAQLATVLIDHPDVRAALFRLELYIPDIKAGCQRVSQRQDERSQTTYQEAMILAYCEARANKRPHISPLEMFVGAVLADPWLIALLEDHTVTVDQLRHVVHWGNIVRDVLQHERSRRSSARNKPKTTMNRAMTARPTKLLDAVSFDYTLQAKANQFTPAIGRDHEVAEAFRILQEGNSSVMLLGEPGVGKTTILEGIAELMTAEHVPGPLQDKRLVVTDPGAIISGGGQAGGLEQRMEQLIHEIIMAGNIIWCIEDIHTLLGAGSTQSSIDIGKILMNYISQGYIKVIGTTTTREYQHYLEKQEAFMRRFQVVHVPELTPDSAILVLEGRAPFVESKYQVYFTYAALSACVELTERFMKDRHLPAKAIAVMEEAAILARERAKGTTLVTKEHVAEVVAEKTNVSVTSLTESEAQKLLLLDQTLHARVIGQDEAVTAIAHALRRARADVRDTTRPIASFLFLGPTGVGKTETAKAIAEAYFGASNRMIRLDMSEYSAAKSIDHLMDFLTEAIRQMPFAIVLLDEFEKASPEVHNIFLQVLDDGRLTDAQGRTVDFTNAMIIATSNAATIEIQESYQQGLTHDDIRQHLLDDGVLQKFYRPELLNRFDHIAIFTPLETHELLAVCELLLRQVGKQLRDKGIVFRWTAEAVLELAKLGYHPQFGARPLRRLIQNRVEDGIADLLLSGSLKRRDIVELQMGGKLTIYPAERM
ncbi:MAG: ATP-dependent Clp protease ATP-binding subunit [Patescibacteria group bacterium]